MIMLMVLVLAAALVALAFERLRVASSLANMTRVQTCLANVFAEHDFENCMRSDPFWAVGEAIYIS